MDYLFFFVVLMNLIASYGAFRAGDFNKGFDKLIIAIMFANAIVMNAVQRQLKVLMGEYQKLSDLKSEIIDEQEVEIETLKQENAKLKSGLPIIK